MKPKGQTSSNDARDKNSGVDKNSELLNGNLQNELKQTERFSLAYKHLSEEIQKLINKTYKL